MYIVWPGEPGTCAIKFRKIGDAASQFLLPPICDTIGAKRHGAEAFDNMTRLDRSHWTLAACSAAVLLLLAACGGEPGATQAPATPSASVSTPTPSVTSSPEPTAGSTGQTAPSASSSPEAADTETSPTDSAKTEQPTYRMTKAYNIVPIDKEQSPAKVVLLTFDDGPKSPDTLAPILDALDKHDAKAIFFVNGYRVKAHPELLKEIDDRGQIIGNHSYDHIELGKEKEDKIRTQIESVQTLVKETVGKTPVFFRPPFASSNDAVRAVAKENGLLYMTWSNGSLDWNLGKNVKDKPQAVIGHVMEQLHAGSNILMHELPWTAEALDELLTQLEDKGYGFVDPNAIELTQPGE